MLNHAQLARADLNLLLLFDLLFEERNAGRTAARLNLSPSAISHSLKRLRSTLNDPLFLPNPKGMVPTERAKALAPIIHDIVERAHGVIATSHGFDPSSAVRRFRIGAPDAAIAVVVPRMVERIQHLAPWIDLAIVQLMPGPEPVEPDHAWRDALGEIETGRIDLAILPHSPAPSRFHSVPLYREDFVIMTCRGHCFALEPSIENLVAARHVLVSASGDSSGFVDRLLAERGLMRRVMLTVPNFYMAAAAIASSDLIGALPRRFAADAARNYPVQIVEPPFPVGAADLHAIVPKAAMLDQGIAWLLETVTQSLD